MTYKIAIASTDRIHIDRTFREADSFIIYEVNSDGKYEFLEERRFGYGSENGVSCDKGRDRCKSGCGSGNECNDSHFTKVSLISDCRCLICSHIGMKVHKHLERQAIAAFEVDSGTEDVLDRITEYFYKVDNHQSLQGIAKKRLKEKQ